MLTYENLKLNQKVLYHYVEEDVPGYIRELWPADAYHQAGGRVEIIHKNGFRDLVEFCADEVGILVLPWKGKGG